MMYMRNSNGGIFVAILQSYLLYGFAYHDWIEEEDSEWADERGRADQPDGVDDGHEEHEWGDLWLLFYRIIYSMDFPHGNEEHEWGDL